jgi:hypothetical protein
VAHIKAHHPNTSLTTFDFQYGEDSLSTAPVTGDELAKKRARKKKFEDMTPLELELLMSGENFASVKAIQRELVSTQ